MAINHRVSRNQDAVGIIIRKAALDSTKQLAVVQAVVRRILIIALTILTAAVTAQRVTQLTAVPIVLTIATLVLVLAARGTQAVPVATIRIAATEVSLRVTALEFMAQPVAAQHRAEVSTIRPTVTMSRGATGRPQFH